MFEQMKMKRRPTLPYLVLLPLLAVLLFGNCGGGVRGVVDGMSRARQDRFRDIFAQRQAQRALARQRLHGRARRVALQRLDSIRTARIDSLFRFDSYAKEKFAHRRRKMTRQMLSPDNRPLIPAIRIPIDTR
ncbi:hypothetical protein ACVWYF_002184 [Hymenobacter sp. UYAg731]